MAAANNVKPFHPSVVLVDQLEGLSCLMKASRRCAPNQKAPNAGTRKATRKQNKRNQLSTAFVRVQAMKRAKDPKTKRKMALKRFAIGLSVLFGSNIGLPSLGPIYTDWSWSFFNGVETLTQTVEGLS